MRKKKAYIKLILLVICTCFVANQDVAAQSWEWVKSFESISGNCEGIGIVNDSQDNLYVTGTYTGAASFDNFILNPFGGSDIFLIKLNPQGVVLWVRRIGGNGNDVVRDITIDQNDNIYLTGQFQGSCNFMGNTQIAQGNFDVFTIKVTTNGLLNWVRTGGSNSVSGSDQLDIGEGVAVDQVGSVYVTASVQSTSNATFNGLGLGGGVNSLSARVLIKYTSLGVVQWLRPSNFNFANSDVAVNTLGQIAQTYAPANATGFNSNLIPVRMLNSNGNFALQSDTANLFLKSKLLALSGGKILMANNINPGNSRVGNFQLTSSGGTDGLIAQINGSGGFDWVRRIGGAGNDLIQSITDYNNLGFAVCGQFNNSIAIDTINLQSSGTRIFIASFDAASNVVWALEGGSGNGDIANDLSATSLGEVYTTGKIFGNAQFGDFNLKSGSFTAVFVGKVGCKPNKEISLNSDSIECLGRRHYSLNNPESYTINWNISNGGNIIYSSNDSLVVDWFQAGNQTIVATPENQCGQGNPLTKNILTISKPNKADSIIGDFDVCIGTHSYSVVLPGNANNVVWNSQLAINPVVIGNTIINNYNTSGIDSLKVYFENQCGYSDTLSQEIIIEQSPQTQALISGNNSACSGIEQYIITNPSSGVNYSWNLTSGGVLNQISNGVNVNWNQSGIHSLTVFPINKCGSGPISNLLVNVSSKPDKPVLLSGSKNLCLGIESYNLLSRTGETFSWQLNSGGAIVPNNTNASVIWNTSGNHLLQAISQNQCGVGDTLNIEVKVNDIPQITDSILGLRNVCIGNQAYFVAQDPNVNYQWNVNAGGILSPNGNRATINWINAGNYTLSVTPQNSCGTGNVVSANITVTNNVNPNNGVLGPTAACLDTVSYTQNTILSGGIAWNVAPGANVINTGDTLQLIFDSVGTYNITATQSGQCSNRLIVEVIGVPQRPVIEASDSIFCQGQRNFSLTSKLGENYLWSTTNAAAVTSTPLGDNVIINFQNIGLDTIKTIANNACGQSDLAIYIVNILSIPNPTEIIGDTLVCKGSNSLYQVSLDSNAQYAWTSNGGKLTQGGNLAQVLWQDTGIYTININANNQCGSSQTLSQNIFVYDPPQPPANIFGADSICIGQANYSVATTTDHSYQWILSSGGILNGNQGLADVIWNQGGTHTIGVIAANQCGLSIPITKTIFVKTAPPKPTLLVGDTTPCLGQSIYVVSGSKDVNHIWSLPGGGAVINFNSDTCTAQFANSGFYLLRAIPSNACGFGPSLDLNIRAILPPSAPQIAGDTLNCLQQKTYSVSLNSGETYIWSLNGGGTLNASQTTANVNWLSPGMHQLNVLGQNKCGIGAPGSLQIRVNDRPSKPSLIFGDTLPCLGTQHYAVNNIPNVKYSWRGPVNYMDTSNTIGFLWSTTNATTIRVNALNNCGVSDTLKLNILPQGLPNDTLLINGNNSSCLTTALYTTQSTSSQSVFWSLNGGGALIPSGDSSFVQWSGTGSFSISAALQNKCGLGPMAVKNVLVLDVPQQAGNINGSAQVCINDSTTYQTPMALGNNYLWALSGGGAIQSQTNQATVKWNQAGVFQIIVTPFNICGTGSPNNLAVSVSEKPQMPILTNNDSIFCIGTNFLSSVQFQNTLYHWSLDSFGIVIFNQNNAVLNLTDTGKTNIKVSTSNICGFSDTLIKKISIIDVPRDISPIIGDTLTCYGIQSYASKSKDGNIIWSLGQGGSIQPLGDFVNVNWNQTGTFSLRAIANNVCGNGVSNSLNVKVKDFPQALTALNGEELVCNGDSVVYITNPQAEADYLWTLSGGGQLVSKNDSATIFWKEVGNFVLSVIPQNECGFGFGRNINVTVQEKPRIQGVAIGDTLACLGDVSEFRIPGSNANTYLWSVSGSNKLIAVDNNALVEWFEVGLQNVELLVTNICGVSPKLNYPVRVENLTENVAIKLENEQLKTVFPHRSYQWTLNGNNIPGANEAVFTPNQNGLYQLWASSSCKQEVGSNKILIEESENAMFVFPNPTNDFLNVIVSENLDWARMQILNITGQVIEKFENITAKSSFIIDVSNLSSGVYFIQLQSRDLTINKKFVVNTIR